MRCISIDKTHPQNKQPLNFDYAMGKKARNFHKTIPGYQATPLENLQGLADICGLHGFFVKDESKRFGLNAFKGLGGIFAMHRLLEGDSTKHTFVTATDGNHGRGIAWAAKMLGQTAYVYMPKGTATERLDNIKKLGANAQIMDMIYDDCVRYANKMAEENNWLLIQDTSWDGYEKIPALIMQGYTTMGMEIIEQIGNMKPTHIFLQAGVGSMAAAMAGFFTNFYKDEKPIISIVEPENAACIYKTAAANDGKLHSVKDLNSIMAGLCCGEPCSIAWPILERYADFAIACPDYIAANGMRILGNPAPSDNRIISGESGAVTVGAVVEIMQSKPDIKEQLGLDEKSTVLCISTEGDTDKQNYRNITWYGAYQSAKTPHI